MKNFRIFAVCLALCLLLTGCSFIPSAKPIEPKTFEMEFYGLCLTADDSYKEVEDKGEWDLQITNGNAYISVMAYYLIDLAEDQNPKGIYDSHNEDIFSTRDNISVIKSAQTQTQGQKTITKTRYSGEWEGNKNYYDSYLLEFEGGDVFAFVLVTGTPSYIENTKELEEIVHSISITE